MILIKCDSCTSEADIDSEEHPQLLELLLGGDPVDGDGSQIVAEWHACASCREAFFKSLPVAVKTDRRGERVR